MVRSIRRILAGDARCSMRSFLGDARPERLGTRRRLFRPDNKFVFQPFWHALCDHDGSGQWEESFGKAKQVALLCLLNKDTARLLCIGFDRRYVLRCSRV
jgi:hypothetical protein